ncbi:MAG TPA: aspartate/glutamate racemase family protein [Clostridia bacterium]|nr:aspartate/glutamate racemase family protein [Clostridia bacterium]
MKIMVINPNSSMSMTEHLEKVLGQIKSSDTELTVICPPGGPMAIESAYDEALCIPGVLKLVSRANLEGYDAIILACFSDPGLEACREISDILVTGIEEISLHVAAMMGAKFTVLTMNRERVPAKEKEGRRFKLENSMASVRPLGMSVAETDSEPDRARDKIRRIAKQAVEEDGAEAIVLGCAGMAGYAEGITEELGVMVIDPSSVALKVTEALVAAKVRHAKCGFYATPPCIRRAAEQNQTCSHCG